MEFPTLGRNCDEPTCRRLDFLPVQCDACKGVFCHSHMSYVGHNCAEGKLKDFQVPVCPLCNKPVPSKRGVAPDIAVSAHIDADCDSDKARFRRKVNGNRCSLKGCKRKEMVPIKCSQCSLNHCLPHRHPNDHACLSRMASNNKRKPTANGQHQQNMDSTYQSKAENIQGSMSEDEALARAMQLSMADNAPRSVNPSVATRISRRVSASGHECMIS